MIAILEAYKAGLLKAKHWKPNILSGLIVGIVALPLAMAFAIASGLKPEQGIYTAIIAGLIIGLVGGTRTQISGPTGAFVVVLAAITAKYGVIGLQISTIFAGLILCLMGLSKLGSLVKFIPHSVVVGFTSGIGVIIFVSQCKDFFGLSVSLPIDALLNEKLIVLIKALPTLDLTTTGLALLSLVILWLWPRLTRVIPSPLAAMLCVTGIQYYFNFEHVATIGSVFGPIPQSLPKFEWPSFSQISPVNLALPAFTIAMLGAIESLLSARAADVISGTKHNANQELIGQGLANITAPLFGGFASTGAIARTVTNIRHGGNSPIAAIVHSIVLILTLIVFAPFAVHIPFAALAAILFVVAFNMGDFPAFFSIIKQESWQNSFVLLTTFILTIFVDLIIAVTAGTLISKLLTYFGFAIKNKDFSLD